MWIYEHHEWPDFFWNNDALAFKLADLRFKQGKLLGRMEGLGFELQQEARLHTLTNDVVKSWAIEGEHLNQKEVHSSIARRLGMDIAGLAPASRDVEGVVEMMLDATRHFTKPLTAKRLFDWHAALFPTGRSGMHKITVGAWRSAESGPMQVVSGPAGSEKVHFEAPHSDKLAQEMATFLKWFGGVHRIDPVLKAGVAHLWFLSIHPFEDGNGRIARAIGDMALARAENASSRFYSLSMEIESDRKEYYRALERQQRSTLDITDWLEWFLDSLGHAIDNAEDNLGAILFKARLWTKINQRPVNQRQRLIINRMLDNFKGHMNTSKYARLAKCSTDTALRDILDLKARGVFVQNPGGGRSTSYRLTDSDQI